MQQQMRITLDESTRASASRNQVAPLALLQALKHETVCPKPTLHPQPQDRPAVARLV